MNYSIFAYVAFAEPYFPLQAPQQDILRIGERYAAGWNKIRQRRLSLTPGGGIFDWPCFQPLEPIGRREEKVFNVGIKEWHLPLEQGIRIRLKNGCEFNGG